MNPRISTPESEVAKLGSEAAIEAHYLDEALINELFALAELARETVAGWSGMSSPDRATFLGERESAVARADWLAARPAAEVSPLLREAQVNAKNEWGNARGALLELR